MSQASSPGSLVLRPTVAGLLRRDFGELGLALGLPLAFLLAVVTNGKRPVWSAIVGAAIVIVGAVLFLRAAACYIAKDGDEVRARGQLTRSVRCRVPEIKRLYLSNEGVIFWMTRPWSLAIDLTSGERKILNGDMKRFAWLDVFRLADALSRPCAGPAMPYLAFVACGSRFLRTEGGTLRAGGGWALLQRLRGDAATGKLLLNGSSDESWIYLIRGRNLRLEEDWPRDVTPDVVSAAQSYEFQRSALRDEEISMVLRVLEDRWLGATPSQGIGPVSASG